MKNPWRVLGIPKGSARDTIRRGYAAKLKLTNPEDNPEGFKKLREAYEWALQMASYQLLDDEPETLVSDNPDDDVADEERSDRPAAVTAPPIDPEAAALDALVERLGSQLASPWRDDRLALDLFRQVIDHPGMDRLDHRAQTEFRIGHLIAESVPASDSILLDSIKAFEWNRVGRADQWPFSAALDRYEEWKLIAAFERPGHHHYRAWRALTVPTKNRLLRALMAYTPHAGRIAELIDIIDYQSNGLLPSTLPAEVAWWRARVEHGTLDIVQYSWAVGISGLALLFAYWIGFGHALTIACGVIAGGVVAIDRFGRDGAYARLFNRLLDHRKKARRAAMAMLRAWPWSMALLPFLVLVLPATAWAAALVVILCLFTVVSLSMSGNRQPMPLAALWSAALVLVVVIALSIGGVIQPSPPRLVMVIAVGAMLTQPFAASLPYLLGRLDDHLRGFGSLGVVAYGAAIVAAAFWAIGQGLIEPVAASGIVVMVLWVIVPLIASSPFMLVRLGAIVARIGSTLTAMFLLGLANPLSASLDMSNGEAIVALHLGLSGQQPLPEVAAAMSVMKLRNPDLYQRIQRALPSQPFDNERIDSSIMAIDAMLDRAVPDLVPVTSPALAGRYQRAKIDVFYAVRKTDAAKCADGKLEVSPDLDEIGRRKILAALLAVAAYGRDESAAKRLTRPPREEEFDKAVATLWPTVDATTIQAGVSPTIRARCSERIARAQALADLPDEAIAAVLSQAAPSLTAPAAPAPPSRR